MHTARWLRVCALGAITASTLLVTSGASALAKPFIDRFATIKTIASAVPKAGPAKGDDPLRKDHEQDAHAERSR